MYALNDVYERIETWNDFAPWLGRIESFSEAKLQGIADEIPCEWYGERAELQRLLDCLLERRSIVRQPSRRFQDLKQKPIFQLDGGAAAAQRNSQ